VYQTTDAGNENGKLYRWLPDLIMVPIMLQ